MRVDEAGQQRDAAEVDVLDARARRRPAPPDGDDALVLDRRPSRHESAAR